MSLAQSGVGVLVLIAAALTALATIGHYIRKGVRSVMRFANRLEKAFLTVEKELLPNGGSSLRDAVNRIQAQLGIDNVTIDSHKDGH